MKRNGKTEATPVASSSELEAQRAEVAERLAAIDAAPVATSAGIDAMARQVAERMTLEAAAADLDKAIDAARRREAAERSVAQSAEKEAARLAAVERTAESTLLAIGAAQHLQALVEELSAEISELIGYGGWPSLGTSAIAGLYRPVAAALARVGDVEPELVGRPREDAAAVRLSRAREAIRQSEQWLKDAQAIEGEGRDRMITTRLWGLRAAERYLALLEGREVKQEDWDKVLKKTIRDKTPAREHPSVAELNALFENERGQAAFVAGR